MDESLFVLLLLSGLSCSSSAVSRQYNYINLRMSWSDAQSYCRERFTDLATVDTMDDVKRLINTVDAGYNGSVWIGLKRGTQKCWGWSNREDKLQQHTNWKYRHLKDEDECGDFALGVWQSYPCSSNLPFVCYSESIGLISMQKLKNWTEAQSFCRKRYTDLVNIRNSKEHKQLKSVTPLGSWIWTGLYRNSWEWSDKLSRFFRYWAAGQPSQSAGSGDCVSMSQNNSGKWFVDNCYQQRPFICYDYKVIKKQIVSLNFSCKEKCALNNPSAQTAILNKISEKLKSLGMENNSNIQWRKQELEDVFHENKVENKKPGCTQTHGDLCHLGD
ncbi:putative C-type lectin domain family 20 member A [Danio rerio]|uniref:C-type lectin domain family 20 member A n=1 Tax=Danio rerio TaxID=7955 RepID=A0AC58HY57_DANRE